jgi:fumarate hydratase class II
VLVQSDKQIAGIAAAKGVEPARLRQRNEGKASVTTRTETDSIGAIEVPADAYWGAQTQRSIENFPFGEMERMPLGIVHAQAIVKQAAARVNVKHGLDPKIAEVIDQVAQEIVDGKLDDQFPLVIWQTGSGTQTNMNANEVIAAPTRS